MTRLLLALLLVAILVAPAGAQRRSADTTNSNRTEYWNTFEREFDAFITRAVDGFKDPQNFDASPEPSDSVLIAASTAASDSQAAVEAYQNQEKWSWHGEYGASAKFARFGIPRHVSWLDEYTKPPDFLFRYNRVEGLFLGLGTEKKYYWKDGRELAPYGSGGYAFKAHRWWGDLGLARQIVLGERGNDLLEFGVEGYDMPDSKDRWMISQNENTLAAFFIHEDFRDWYERRGLALHGSYYLRGKNLFAEASLSYLVESEESMEALTDWALFGGSKTFRDNPAINSGKLRSILARLGYSTATGANVGKDGWDMHASAEVSGREFGGEFLFQRYVVDLRRYQQLGEFDNINFRFRAGTAHGDLPVQRTFELGGLGTLPGYRFKEFPGDTAGANRMLLFNAEYMLNGDVLHDLKFWPSFIMRHLNLLFIMDAGLVRRATAGTDALAGFGGITWDELRSDVGVGVCNERGSWRIGAAWRTDRAEKARLFLRVEQPF